MAAITPQALQDYLYAHIPLSKAMAVEVKEATPQSVLLAAPLAPNINHRDTVFGGSASTLAILSAWALLHVSMAEANIKARLVIQKNTMNYDLPMPGEFSAEATAPAPEKWLRFLATLQKHKRARVNIRSILHCDGQQAGTFEGDFVASIL
ncbi:MAG: thioesterase domain-containing protein [Gammaproteobacteria bacterium]|nr:thioesterase domain-containing protein [Gammaproteobacteria bacterium]MBU1482299.1 thioesterase domain-containing protein [Gammaproteobacteria bacterium]